MIGKCFVGIACAVLMLTTPSQAATKVVKQEITVQFGEEFEKALTKHANSKKIENKVFAIAHDGKVYRVRVVTNPDRIKIAFKPIPFYKMGSRFIVAYSQTLPVEIESMINEILGDEKSVFASSTLNGFPAIDATAEILGNNNCCSSSGCC